MIITGRLDLHPGEELREDVDKLSLHLIVESLTTGFWIGEEQRIEN